MTSYLSSTLIKNNILKLNVDEFLSEMVVLKPFWSTRDGTFKKGYKIHFWYPNFQSHPVMDLVISIKAITAYPWLTLAFNGKDYDFVHTEVIIVCWSQLKSLPF